MSPAHATQEMRQRLQGGLRGNTLHSWVGIIMYLPEASPGASDGDGTQAARIAITDAFMR